jgi:hypothetical protein
MTAVALIGGFFSPSAATAVTYYVASNGSDSNPGTKSAPFRSIVHGFSVLSAGDTLYIRGGTYHEAYDGNTQKAPSGTNDSNAPLISNYPGETVIWQPNGGVVNFVSKTSANPGIVQYVKFNGIIFDGSSMGQSSTNNLVNLNGVLHFTFTNSEFRNTPQSCGLQFGDLSGAGPTSAFHTFLHIKAHHNGLNPGCLQTNSCSSGLVGHGIYGSMANSTFDDVEAYNNGDLGMQLYRSTGGVDNNVVRNSRFHDNGQVIAGGGGLYIGSGDGNMAYNNLVYTNPGGGISVGSNATNAKVYNNTVYNNGQGGLVITSATATAARNNILYANGNAYGDLADFGSGTVLSNNLSSDPLFVNTGSADFHLQSGSPAIDKGTPLNIVTSDYDGVPRPQGTNYDIGACELSTLKTALIHAPTNFKISGLK